MDDDEDVGLQGIHVTSLFSRIVSFKSSQNELSESNLIVLKSAGWRNSIFIQPSY